MTKREWKKIHEERWEYGNDIVVRKTDEGRWEVLQNGMIKGRAHDIYEATDVALKAAEAPDAEAAREAAKPLAQRWAEGKKVDT